MEANNPNNQSSLVAALNIAYKAVMALGYNHQRLVDGNLGVNYNTLRRIRDGKAGKPVTDKYFLQLFVSILEKEYQHRLSEADLQGTREILRAMRCILLADQEIPTD